MLFPCLTIFMIFILWFTFKRVSMERKEKNKLEEYWATENQANATRKQDLSQLQYVQIPLESLPFMETAEGRLLHIQDEIKKISEYKIVNLTGYTNTELKLKYGAANLDLLAQYDANFAELLRLLNSWAAQLYDFDFPAKAQTVLEYAVSIDSDVKTTFTLLAKIYKENGTPNKISALIDRASHLNSLSKNIIIKSLQDLLGEMPARI